MNKALINTVFKIFVLLIIAFLAMNTNAQIISPKANAVKSVSYPVNTIDSSVFIFYSPPGKVVLGSLTALPPLAGSYNFDWFMYNSSSDSFDIPLSSQTGVSQSLINDLNGGGYRVHIWNGTDTDTSFIAWVHIDKVLVSIDKDAQDKLMKSAFTCDYLTLSGNVTIDSFFYYDPVNHEKLWLQNGVSFLWTSDNSELIIPNASKILDPNTTYKPPYLDTWYILTAIDSFGMKDVDSVFYESIQVKPLFSFKVFDKEDKEDFIDATPPVEGDAPMKVKFFNESVNGFSYEWIYSDSAKSDFFANEFTSDLEYQPEYLYKIPNDYYPAVVVTSEAGCIDTLRIEQPITVLPSLLEVPNVFSPDGNSSNDYFKVKFQSIKEFNIRIFDRAGKLVYKAEVTDMYSWEGWDGNVLDSKRQASPGAYFYVIYATGWDNEHYHKGQYRGVVYLYRQAQ